MFDKNFGHRNQESMFELPTLKLVTIFIKSNEDREAYLLQRS